ncbi:hypothetical protein FRC02_009207 [Tulasnella sp. 418]|nr:hypothetical protein FRC02_009207 [Tulasnella sp. 418]
MAGGPAATGPGIGASGTPKNKWAGILMTAFAAFGGILFGYDTGVISGIKEMPNWLQTFGKQQSDGSYSISTSTESLIVSILSAGTFVGALLAVRHFLWSVYLKFSLHLIFRLLWVTFWDGNGV